MEQHLGRVLAPEELVHHKDGNKANNALENLELAQWGEHTIAHHSGVLRSDQFKQTSQVLATYREEHKRLKQINADLLEALKGVLRVADRDTHEFDLARAALAKAVQS